MPPASALPLTETVVRSTWGAAVQDHAVIALTHDTADRAPVLGGRGDRAGDGAVRDERACAGLGLIHNTGDDARIDADAVCALDIDLCIFDGDVADDRAVGIGEQTGCDIVRRRLLRADAQAEDLVVLSVENTAETVRSGIACRDPICGPRDRYPPSGRCIPRQNALPHSRLPQRHAADRPLRCGTGRPSCRCRRRRSRWDRQDHRSRYRRAGRGSGRPSAADFRVLSSAVSLSARSTV